MQWQTWVRAMAGRLWRGAIVGVALVVAFAIGVGYFNQGLLAATVDAVRSVVGPGPVAQVETWAFEVEDSLHRMAYQSGAHQQVQWAAPVAVLAPAAAAPPAERHGATGAARITPPAAQLDEQQTPTAASLAPAISSPAPAALDWSPYILSATGQPILERALVAPDPGRPYVQAALVRIDLRSAQLHLMAGTREPLSTMPAARPGSIPPADWPRLLAAFNGGFKAVNGAYGMLAGGTTLLPPQDGLATLALYRDGHVQLGVWGLDMTLTPDIVALRQNCPLLLDAGRLTAAAQDDNTALWGKTVGNTVATWRSGLGLSPDGRYLLYAVGDGLTVPSLGHALAMGGAGSAMQLDINSFWTRFVTYKPTGDRRSPAAQKLLAQMAGSDHQFLTPDERDFFYLTTR